MYYLGFDIGGSSIKAVLVKNKTIIKSAVYDSPANLEDLLISLARMKEELMMNVGREGIAGLGVGVAGTINKKRDIILNSPNIQFLNNQPIKKLLEQKLNFRSIKIEHDVHCFLLAEKEVGLARDLKNVFYLTLGTGIGGAYMIEGKIISGAHGSAGEVGHTIINLKIQNSNFRTAEAVDLEELAANKFIKKSVGIGSAEAEERFKSGDQKVAEVITKMGRNLGVGIANIINIFDPEAIIIAGGINWAKDLLLPGIKEGIDRFVISPAAKETKILFSQLGRFGGALGAALFFD